MKTGYDIGVSPFVDRHGNVHSYDIFWNGYWQGSRKTLLEAEVFIEALRANKALILKEA
jgi:hypothetical protein